MTDLQTAAQQALEYMKSVGKMDMHPEEWAIVGRLEAALAEPQPNTLHGWMFKRNADGSIGIFAPPPKPGESPRTSDCVGTNQRDLNELLGKLADHMAALAEPQEPDSPARRCGGPGCDMTCCQPVAQRGPMFHTHPAVELQRSVESAVRPACGVDPAAKAEPVQEPKPVAWRFEARHIDSAWAAAVTLKHPGPEGVYMRNVMPLYAHPPQRKPLSEEEIHALRLSIPATTQWLDALVLYTRAVERAHGIGGEG